MPITELSPAVLEALAQAIHERYRANQARRKLADDPAMADWRALPPHLRRSNRAQAADIIPKLSATGYAVHEASDGEAPPIAFSTTEIERMAVMEHERWTAERLGDGWRPGERDVPERRTPDLVSWAELSEEKREWDREAVRAIPELLSGVGFEIRRTREPADDPTEGVGADRGKEPARSDSDCQRGTNGSVMRDVGLAKRHEATAADVDTWLRGVSSEGLDLREDLLLASVEIV